MAELVLTVGSTRFDELVMAILEAVPTLPFDSMLLQIGALPLSSLSNARLELGEQRVDGKLVEVVRYTDDIEERIARARVVVGHAGAGTVLSFLRPLSEPAYEKRTLVLVPNDSLMVSHQSDLAHEMRRGGYAIISSVDSVASLLRNLPVRNGSTTKVPPKADIGPILNSLFD